MAEICRRHGISDATFYMWRSKYGGREVSDAKRLQALEEENGKLKKLLAAWPNRIRFVGATEASGGAIRMVSTGRREEFAELSSPRRAFSTQPARGDAHQPL